MRVGCLRTLMVAALLSGFCCAQNDAAPASEHAKTARKSAAWVASGVIYEINPRTFSAAGNFRGIEEQLPRLRDLGVTILWLMPIHPPGQLKKKGSLGSAYAVRDYYAINPDYGTAADLKHLVTAAHAAGFKIIIDMVANHTAWDSVLMAHPEFYKHDAAGNIIPPDPDWSDVAGLDYRNPELRRYMIDMLKYWLREFDLDGFRCDVAFMVPTDFWEEARRALETVKSDIVMLAEAHKPELLVKAFDLDYAWPFHADLTAALENGKPATVVAKSWEATVEEYPKGAMEMRFSDDHDEKRAIARFGERGALAASALVFTMPGVPLLYNGMEVGDTTESTAPALFEKLPVFWAMAERRPEFPLFYRGLIALRKAHAALQQGALEWLANSDGARVLTYRRRAGSEEFLIAINCSNEPFSGTAQFGGDWREITPEMPGSPHALAAPPALTLGAWGFRIFEHAAAVH